MTKDDAHSEPAPPRRRKQIATQEEMMKAKVPLAYRDECAHLLIPLNECRVKSFYLPWKCAELRHRYDLCERELVMYRIYEMDQVKKEALQRNLTPAQVLAEREQQEKEQQQLQKQKEKQYQRHAASV